MRKYYDFSGAERGKHYGKITYVRGVKRKPPRSAKLYDELTESIREVGAILRGEIKPERVFRLEAKSRTRSNPKKHFAICVKTDDPELLISQKIYQVTVLATGRIKVMDEAGEAAIYPEEHFVIISLPPDVEKQVLRAARR